VAPLARRVGRLGFGTQGCVEHVLLVAHDDGLRPVCKNPASLVVRHGARVVRARTDVQADARDASMRPAVDRFVASGTVSAFLVWSEATLAGNGEGPGPGFNSVSSD